MPKMNPVAGIATKTTKLTGANSTAGKCVLKTDKKKNFQKGLNKKKSKEYR